jgi:hypothetical protein
VAGAFTEASASARALAVAVGDSASVSAPLGDLATKLAAATATSLQNGRLKKTSAVIRELLASIRKLVEQETPLYASVREELERVSVASSLELYHSGIGRPHPLMRELLDCARVRVRRAPGEHGAGEGREGGGAGLGDRADRPPPDRAPARAGARAGLQLRVGARAARAAAPGVRGGPTPLDARAVGERLAAFRQIVDILAELRQGRSVPPETQP